MSEAILPAQPALDTFGAPKEDMGIVVDPTKVITARDWNNVAAMLVAIGFPLPRARVTVSAAGAILSFKAVWGTSPAPTIDHVASSGTYAVTMPSTVTDPLSGSQPFAVEATGVSSNTASRSANSRHAGNVVTVDTLNPSTLALADAAFTLLVY